MLWISEATANRLLKRNGHTVAELRSLSEELGDEEVFTLPTGVAASMEVRGTVRERTPARNVIGHLPGTSAESDDRLIVVMAQYDTPPPKPDGNINPSANDNASGVAVMLEAIRTIQETGYQPYKTFLFVAYSGEGREGGLDVSNPEVSRFLQAKYGFSDSFTPEAVVRLQGVGAGRGNGLDLSAGGSLLLANLFEAAGRQMGVATHQTQEALDLGIVFEEQQLMAGGQEVPSITMSWEGWQETARLPADSVESVSPDKLQQAGRVLSLALMNLGRETQY